jgi:agmatine/peptidylarginine deiminase
MQLGSRGDLDLLAGAFPGREIVQVDVRPLILDDGGLRCNSPGSSEVEVSSTSKFVLA